MKRFIAFILAFFLAFGNIGVGFTETPVEIPETNPVEMAQIEPQSDYEDEFAQILKQVEEEEEEIVQGQEEEETVTESPTPVVTESPTPTPAVTNTPTPTPEITATPTVEVVTETPSSTPSETPSPTPTESPSPTPTETPTATPTPTPRPITVTKQLLGEIWQVRCDTMDGTSFQAGGGYWKADITNYRNVTSAEGHRSNHCGDWENWVLFVNENGEATGLYQLKSGSTGGTLPSIVYRPQHNLSKDQIINIDPTNVTDPVLNMFKENYAHAMPFSEINLVEGERLWWTSQNGGQMWHHTGVLRKTTPRFAIVINGVPYSLGVGESITLTDVEDGLVQVDEISTANYKLHEIQHTDDGDVIIINEVDDPDRPTPKPPKPLETITPTPSPTPSPTPTATPTVTPSPTPTMTPSSSPTPSPSPTSTPEVTATPTPHITDTPTPEVTDEPSPTPYVSPSPLPTPTPTSSPTKTPDPTGTPTATIKPTPTATPAITATPSPSPSGIPILTPTPTPTSTPTLSPIPTVTTSITPEPTNIPTPTRTPKVTPKPTPALTPYVDPEGHVYPIHIGEHWYRIIENYGTPLGISIPYNQVGDCFE